MTVLQLNLIRKPQDAFLAWKCIISLLTLLDGNPSVIGIITHKERVMRTFDFWQWDLTGCRTSSRFAGDMRLYSYEVHWFSFWYNLHHWLHYNDVIMSSMASQITGVSIGCSNICSGGDQRKHQSSASMAFVRGIHLWPRNSSTKGSVTRKMFPFDDIMYTGRKLSK